MSDANFSSGWRDVYTLIPDAPVSVEAVLGSATPMKLALPVQVTKRAQKTLATPPEGAILGILLDQQTALNLYVQMQKVAKDLGWQMPRED